MGPRFEPTLWPDRPRFPDGQPSLLQLTGTENRAAARIATRRAAAATLNAWLGAKLAWKETPTGPRPIDVTASQDIQVSFSYAGTEAWIAFHRGPVGFDACPIADFPERAEVTRLYLPESPVGQSIEAFARRWARREATLKYRGLGLTEGSTPPPADHCFDWTEGEIALALAWADQA
jgi:phosphopantetheinyl transferase